MCVYMLDCIHSFHWPAMAAYGPQTTVWTLLMTSVRELPQDWRNFNITSQYKDWMAVPPCSSVDRYFIQETLHTPESGRTSLETQTDLMHNGQANM